MRTRRRKKRRWRWKREKREKGKKDGAHDDLRGRESESMIYV